MVLLCDNKVDDCSLWQRLPQLLQHKSERRSLNIASEGPLGIRVDSPMEKTEGRQRYHAK